MKKIITRHQSLVSYLQEVGLTNGTEEVLSHASADDSRDHDEWASRFAAAQNAATAILQVRTRSNRTDPDFGEENDAAVAVLEDSGYAGFMDLLSLAREIADEREEGIY